MLFLAQTQWSQACERGNFALSKNIQLIKHSSLKNLNNMKKLTIMISAFLFLTAFTTAKIVWKNDDPHSQLGFTVTHLGVSDVSGTVNDFDVTVISAEPDFSDAVFELTANVASLDT